MSLGCASMVSSIGPVTVLGKPECSSVARREEEHGGDKDLTAKDVGFPRERDQAWTDKAMN